MNKEELNTILQKIDINEIKLIIISTVGLLDVFGKLILDITFLDGTKKQIQVCSPVPVDVITIWLDTNKLLDITTLYRY